MNISILTPRLNGGGAERIAGLLSKELSKQNSVYLFLLKKEEVVYEYGGEIVYLEGDSTFFESSLKKNKEKYNIDCSISFLEPMNFANIRTKGKERVIISERSIQSCITPRHYAEDDKLRRYYNFADAVVACSYGVKQDLIEKFNIQTPINVIYNFVNQDRMKKAGEEGISEEVFSFLGGCEYFISIGRLHEEKNPIRLIRQYHHFIKNSGANIKLIIIGSGQLLEILEKTIKRLGLANKVLVLPFMPNPFPYMKFAKALILCSEYEGLPNVVLESMVMGCPVIASDCLAGPRELLADEMDYSNLCTELKVSDRGILVSNNHSEDDCSTTYLADAMKYICDHPEYVVAVKKNQKEYMCNYSNEKLLEQWYKTIEDNNNNAINIIERENKWIDGFEKKIIMGCSYCARVIYENLKSKYSITAFVEDESGMHDVDGIPIIKIDEYKGSSDDTVFILGKGERGQDTSFAQLTEYGYKNIIFPYIGTNNNVSAMDVVNLIKAEYNNQVVVIGAGEYGRNLINYLVDMNVDILCVFDNNTKLYGKVIKNTVISQVKRVNERCLYLITLYDADNKEKWEKNLIKLGINYNDIICFHL